MYYSFLFCMVISPYVSKWQFILHRPHDIAILSNVREDFSLTGEQLYQKLYERQILDGTKPFNFNREQ